MATFKGKIRSVLLKDFVKQIEIAADEAILHITAGGLKVSVVDPAHVMFVEIGLSKGDFEEYRAIEEFKVGVMLVKFTEFIAAVKGEIVDVLITNEKVEASDEPYKWRHTYEGGGIKITIGNVVRQMPVVDLAGMSEPPNPSEGMAVEKPTEEVITTTKNFAVQVKAAYAAASEFIGLYTHARRWGINAGRINKAVGKNEKDFDWSEPYPAFSKTVLSTFAPDYISGIAKAIVARQEGRPLKIIIGGNAATIIEYSYNHGSIVRYFLAPILITEKDEWPAIIEMPVGGAKAKGEKIGWTGEIAANQFRRIIVAANVMAEEAVIIAEGRSFTLGNVDPAHVAMMSAALEISSGEGKKQEIGINVEKVLETVKKWADNEPVKMEISSKGFYLTRDGKTIRFDTVEGLSNPKIPKLSDMESVYPIMPAPLLNWVNKAAGKISDHTELYIAKGTSATYFGAATEEATDYATYQVILDMKNAKQVIRSITTTSIYPLDYLSNMLTALKDGPVQINFKTDYPLKIVSDDGITMLLGPRIEGDGGSGEARGVPPLMASPEIQSFQHAAWLKGESKAHRKREGTATAIANAEPIRPRPEQEPPAPPAPAPTPAEPPAAEATLFNDTYTGPRWTYGLKLRPLASTNVPKGFIIMSGREHPDLPHGTVDYPRQLTDKEIGDFDLTYIEEKPTTRLSTDEVGRLNRIIAVIKEDEPQEGYLEAIKKITPAKIVFYIETMDYTTIWEHPKLAVHNKSAGDLSHYFHTLYQNKENPRIVVFTVGRIGNTTSIMADLSYKTQEEIMEAAGLSEEAAPSYETIKEGLNEPPAAEQNIDDPMPPGENDPETKPPADTRLIYFNANAPGWRYVDVAFVGYGKNYWWEMTREEFAKIFPAQVFEYHSTIDVDNIEGTEYEKNWEGELTVEPAKRKYIEEYVAMFKAGKTPPEITVKGKRPGHPDDKYQLTDGHRRVLAARIAGTKKIPALIVPVDKTGSTYTYTKIVMDAIDAGRPVPEKIANVVKWGTPEGRPAEKPTRIVSEAEGMTAPQMLALQRLEGDKPMGSARAAIYEAAYRAAREINDREKGDMKEIYRVLIKWLAFNKDMNEDEATVIATHLLKVMYGWTPPPPSKEIYYTVIHQNVDGAGTFPAKFPTKEDAIDFANRHQAESDASIQAGVSNPWRYTYHVFRSDSDREIYATKLTENKAVPQPSKVPKTPMSKAGEIPEMPLKGPQMPPKREIVPERPVFAEEGDLPEKPELARDTGKIPLLPATGEQKAIIEARIVKPEKPPAMPKMQRGMDVSSFQHAAYMSIWEDYIKNKGSAEAALKALNEIKRENPAFVQQMNARGIFVAAKIVEEYRKFYSK